jgi:biotin carboxylase
VAGVGGQGFRTLTTAPLSLDELLAHPTARVTLDEAVEALDKAGPEATPPLLVMPYLTGPEVSVDCLATPAGTVLAALPRVKVGRERRLVEDPAAVEVARTLVERHRLGLLSNTQVRYWQHPLLDDGPRPYYLETNARMSGGLYQTAASGLNLPWAAVRLARGLDAGLGEPRLGARWTTVESMVPLG